MIMTIEDWKPRNSGHFFLDIVFLPGIIEIEFPYVFDNLSETFFPIKRKAFPASGDVLLDLEDERANSSP
jgi:hypothetical protein